MLALIVQLDRAQGTPRGTVPEGVVLEGLHVCGHGRGGDDASVVVGRRLRPREERGHEQLGEVKVAHDGRAELEVVPVVGELVDRRCQDSSACGVWNPLWGGGRG